MTIRVDTCDTRTFLACFSGDFVFFVLVWQLGGYKRNIHEHPSTDQRRQLNILKLSRISALRARTSDIF